MQVHLSALPRIPSLEAPRSRRLFEAAVRHVLLGCGLMAVVIAGLTAWTFFAGSVPFFEKVGLVEFLTSVRWAPITVPEEYGTFALIADTAVITLISLLVAVPLGVMAAVFLSEYCSPRLRKVLKPVLEVLGGIPTVVYGFFALRTITPWLQEFFPSIGFWNGISAGVVMGFMILPLVASLSEDVLYAVPRSLREAAYALGATR
ncbi:MAG: ABC transporter permease subunit, partial [Planctomycetes bacterium]|nr:ABC transporter permease subunit [Planctomycetota bacterium]